MLKIILASAVFCAVRYVFITRRPRIEPVVFGTPADFNAFFTAPMTARQTETPKVRRHRPIAVSRRVADDDDENWLSPFFSRPSHTVADAPPGTNEFLIGMAAGIGVPGMIAGTDHH